MDLRIFTTLPDNRTSLEIELFHFLRLGKQELIGSQTIHGRYSDWVVFNLKPRFRRWLRRNRGDLSNYQLQVKLRSLSLNKLQIGGLEDSEKAPLLVVFSKEPKKTKTNQQVKQVSASPSSLFTEGRTKRGAALSQRRRRICRRKPMYIDFKSIGWDSWVIAPRGYQAYKCAGKCTIPISTKYDPTNHAVVQTLAHDTGSKTRAACCVPKKLGPISMLYEDNNVITFRYKYEGMVVQSCACRWFVLSIIVLLVQGDFRQSVWIGHQFVKILFYTGSFSIFFISVWKTLYI